MSSLTPIFHVQVEGSVIKPTPKWLQDERDKIKKWHILLTGLYLVMKVAGEQQMIEK
jgi:hypothetical protein